LMVLDHIILQRFLRLNLDYSEPNHLATVLAANFHCGV
jgi:hypothetical protein